MIKFKKIIAPLLFILVSSLLLGIALFFFIPASKPEEKPLQETSPLPGKSPLGGKEGETLAYKNETVYVLLDPEGRVVDQRIVNRIYKCENQEAGKVKDYGEYVSINNMTSEAAPTVQDDTLLWDSALLQQGDIYYEGITGKELPVDFQIDYYLDGVKKEPSALSGKNGRLRIVISMKNNLEIGDAVTYRNYYGQISRKEDVNYVPLLVQGTYSADLNRFSEIEATDGAAIITGQSANVSFMAFPYPDAEIVLSMQGEDIELSQIMLVIMPQLPPIPDIDMEDDLNKMLEGITAIEKGLTAIYEGADELYKGLDLFRNKSNEMLREIEPLLVLLEELPGFVNEYLLENEDLLSQLERLLEYLDRLPGGLPEPPELPGEFPAFPELPGELPEIPEGFPEDIIPYLESVKEFVENFDDLEQYLSEAEQALDQLAALPAALDQLADGQKAIRDGLGEINSRGIAEIKKGLVDGINENRYGKAKVELMRSLADDFRSHADNEKNRSSSVQFILQTENMAESKTIKPDPEKEQNKGNSEKAWYVNLWSRFLALFTSLS